jgi:hypothetical protein
MGAFLKAYRLSGGSVSALNATTKLRGPWPARKAISSKQAFSKKSDKTEAGKP